MQRIRGCTIAAWLVAWSALLLVSGTAKSVVFRRLLDASSATDVNVVRQIVNDIALLGSRIPGSAGQALAVDYCITFLSRLPGVSVSLDSFEDETPLGRRPFHNILARVGPRWSSSSSESMPKTIVLAAHHDSKILGEDTPFVGASDSLVSCALLLALIRDVSHHPDLVSDVALEIVLFDGEEALVEWKDSDHTYGSRHLARQWEASGQLASVSLFVLLDLLGSSSRSLIHNLYAETAADYRRLEQLHKTLLRSQGPGLPNAAGYVEFSGKNVYHLDVQDDHIPFRTLGLMKTLHLIPIPFPEVWHTPLDDLEHLDWAGVAHWHRLLLLFVLDMISK